MRTCNIRDQVNSLYLHSIKHDFSPFALFFLLLHFLRHFIKMEYGSIRAFPFSTSMPLLYTNTCVHVYASSVLTVFHAGRTSIARRSTRHTPRSHKILCSKYTLQRVTGTLSRTLPLSVACRITHISYPFGLSVRCGEIKWKLMHFIAVCAFVTT